MATAAVEYPDAEVEKPEENVIHLCELCQRDEQLSYDCSSLHN